MATAGYLHQFWTFDRDHQACLLLNRGEATDLAGYPAGFRFSPDSQWLVRMQKMGAGYQTLFLYRRKRDSILIRHGKAARAIWPGITSWALPAIRSGCTANPKDRYSLSHVQANLLKGMEDNYAWLGQHWPDSRYVVISLSFDVQGEEQAPAMDRGLALRL